MKLPVFLLFISLQSSLLFGQHHIIGSNRKARVIYVGLDNTIEFLVEDASCNKYLLSSNDIVIIPDENSCTYTVKPEKPGIVKVLVKSRDTKEIAFEAKFNAVFLPPPTFNFAGQNHGDVRKVFAKAQVGLIATLDGFDIQVRYEIEKFMVIIMRNDEVLYCQRNNGAKFIADVKNRFQEIEKGDKLIFADVFYKGPEGISGTLSPIEFNIID